MRELCYTLNIEDAGLGTRQRAGRALVCAGHTDGGKDFRLTLQAKMVSTHAVISYQRLDSNLANIKEKVNSTIYFTSEI
jgi:hypothetical protein